MNCIRPLPASRPAGATQPGANNSPITRSNWLNAVAEKMSAYFPFRTDIVLDQLRNQGLFPYVTAPRFSINGGEVPSGTSLTV